MKRPNTSSRHFIGTALGKLFLSLFTDETANGEAFRMNNSTMWFISTKSC